MKNLSSDLWKLVMCLAEMVIGILLFINPVSFTSGIIMILGVCLVRSEERRVGKECRL